MDGAVTYAFLAQLTSIAGSIGTVLLIVRFLSPVEQGYYYTLLSLVSLQVVFELGFSFVIQQLAAHECVHLEFGPDGSVSGDPQATPVWLQRSSSASAGTPWPPWPWP